MLHGRKYAVECNNKKHVQVILILCEWLLNCGKRYICIACISKHITAKCANVCLYFSLPPSLSLVPSTCLSLLFFFARYKQNLFAFAVAFFPIYNAIILCFYFIRLFVQFTHSLTHSLKHLLFFTRLLPPSLSININPNGFHVSTNSNYLLSLLGLALLLRLQLLLFSHFSTQPNQV